MSSEPSAVKYILLAEACTHFQKFNVTVRFKIGEHLICHITFSIHVLSHCHNFEK
jgi:hypothetical protein